MIDPIHPQKKIKHRPKMATSRQLIVFFTCSLALGAVSALGGETKYSNNSKDLASGPKKSSKNLNAISASASHLDLGYAPPAPYYQTIVDRTGSPDAMATSGDLHTAAGHHHSHHHGKYYEYREVPKKKTWKFGYKRGNHKHTISRHEHGKAGKHPHFKTKVKWHDKKSKGKGIHLWDYNHHDKKHHYHG